MTTSDDEYGFDDLVLDDRTLAVLDQTEQSLTAAISSTSHSRSPPEQQPTKRLKTTGGWAPRYGQQAPERSSLPPKGLTKSRFSLEDTDLPEITICNGFYSGPGRFFVGSQHSELTASPKAQLNGRESAIDSDSDVVLLPTGPQQAQVPGRTVVPSSNHTLKRFPLAQSSVASQSNRERTLPPNLIHGPRKPTLRHPSPALGSANVPRPTPLTRSSSFSDTMRAALRNALSQVDGPPLRPSSSSASSSTLSQQPLPAFQDELDSLRSRMEELKRQNAEQQRSLDQAISEKRSKMGEIEILRATLDKTKATHKEENDKLREAKENLEAAQVAAQKKQEAELERLRTQLVFKQHEVEASHRAAPRAPLSSQFADSTQPPRSDIPSTPRIHNVTASQNLSPQRPVAAPPRVSKTRPPPPGFINAFVMPPSKNNKGKPTASVTGQGQDLQLPPHDGPVKAPTQPPPDEEMEIDRDEVRGQAANTTYSEVDFHMDVVDDVKTPQPDAGCSKAVEPFDWVGWMRQLVLAHTPSPDAPSTVQQLLAQPPFDAKHQGTFHSACASLIGATVGSAEYQPVVRVVADSLTQIANILLHGFRLKPLISTLNLLGHLVICLPLFAINLLKLADGLPFLQTICAIIVNILRPSNTNRKEPDYLSLGREVFYLLDSVTYSLPTEYHARLAVIPQSAGVLVTMLSKDQPPSFLASSTRTLSYLSTRPGLFRSLLSFSEDTPERARDFAKLPQVDRMCGLLMDSSLTGATGHSIRASVLTTLISLAMAHEDALLILSESPFFIPSLVKVLADLSTALWEEDPELTASTVLLSETVAGITQGMLLLHYVIFRTPKGPASLRTRLQAAPPRHFNGIGHQFVVALGRLSFAEPPDEVSVSDRVLLEQLADPARDVMDLVVAGPESESVWSLFQEEDGRGEERGHDRQQGDDGGHGPEDDEIVMQTDTGVLRDSSPPRYM